MRKLNLWDREKRNIIIKNPLAFILGLGDEHDIQCGFGENVIGLWD